MAALPLLLAAAALAAAVAPLEFTECPWDDEWELAPADGFLAGVLTQGGQGAERPPWPDDSLVLGLRPTSH